MHAHHHRRNLGSWTPARGGQDFPPKISPEPQDRRAVFEVLRSRCRLPIKWRHIELGVSLVWKEILNPHVSRVLT
jgi:hypothetical protein